MEPLYNAPMEDATVRVPVATKGSLSVKKYFFVFFGILSLLLVVIGFSNTYFIPVISGKYSGRFLLHVHGAMYLLWIVLGIVQPLLVRLRLTHIHKKIGVAGFILGAGMILMGVTIAVTSAQLNILDGKALEAKSFLLIPLSDMVLFAAYIGLSLLNLKKPETHKRLMVLTTLAILPAAFGRIFSMLGLDSSPLSIVIALLIQESILFLCIAYDMVTQKKIHPVYIWGGAALVIVHVFRQPLGNTETWLSIAEWITRT